MRRPRMLLAVSAVVAVALAAPPPAHGQILKKVKDTAERAAEHQALLEIEERVRSAVRCAFDDVECIDFAKEEGEDVVLVDEEGEVILDHDGKPVSDPERLPPDERAQLEEGAALEANYDFEAGTDVLYEDNFAEDQLGDFPRHMIFVRGNWDIVEREGQRFLRNTGPRHSALKIPLSESLPETFTIEFPVLLYEGNANLALGTSVPPPDAAGTTRVFAYDRNYVAIGSWGVGLASHDDADPTASQDVAAALTSAPVPVRIMADGSYVKVYVGERRVANVPNADLARSDTLWIENTYHASEEEPILIGPIRVAAGGRDLYGVLEAKGRVTMDDILFDTDRASIRAESAETLAEIAAMLEEHPELSLLVEGHTDDKGGFEHNMTLSTERAEAVKSWLVERLAIDPDRLRTIGLGSTRPVAENKSEEGRAKNRRVELVRMSGP